MKSCARKERSWSGRRLMALALCGLMFLLPLMGLAQSKIYWTNVASNNIQRANLDGTSTEDLVIGTSFPQAIALDLAAGKMYWVGVSDEILRANLDGSSVEILVTGYSSRLGIALDLVAGKMYWTDVSFSKIQRANLDGTSVEDLVTGTIFPAGIALDLAAGKMYWTDVVTDKIQRANLDGTGVEDLVTVNGVSSGIALDLAAGKMYWTNISFDARIQRANLDGTSVEDLVTGFMGIFPLGIALDLAAGKMYWTDQQLHKIQRANLDGSSIEDLVTNGLSFPSGIALDVQSVETPVVFVADHLIKIDQNKQSEGDLHCNYGDIQFGKGASGKHTGNLSAGKDIVIDGKNTIEGDATAGDEIQLLGNAKVTGTQTEHATINVIPLPDPSYSASGPKKTVKKNGSLTLPPGSYGEVKVETKGRLYLSAGDYYMNVLNLYASAKIYIDVSGGAVNINVVSELCFGKQVKVEVTGGGTDEVTFTTLQHEKVRIGQKSIVRGELIAPHAEVHFDKECKFKGAVYANKITLDAKVKFQHHQSSASFPKAGETDEEYEEAEAIAAETATVDGYELAQNYPNPFNPSTRISFTLPEAGEVSLAIYNINGQLVKQVASGQFASGRHQVVWDATDDRGRRAASGVYLYVLKAGGFTAQRKLVLMK